LGRKRGILLLMLIVLFLFFCPKESLAGEPHFGISMGAKKDLSGALGFIGASGWGFEVGMVANAEISENDYLNYPCPHTDYITLGWKKDGITPGIDVIYAYFVSEDLFLYGGMGLYTFKYTKLAQSNATGWVYNHGGKTKIKLPFSLGVRFCSSKESRAFLGIGYHEVRGFNLQIEVNPKRKSKHN